MQLIEKYFWIFSTMLVPILYLFVATSFYAVFYRWKAEVFKSNKIQHEGLSASQVKREMIYSMISLGLFMAMGFIVYLIYHYGYSRIYFYISKYGILYFILSIVLMMLFHDLYFYWTHRLLHLPGWYQKIHLVHHLSTNPSPFTSLSFHPVEALIQALILPLIVLCIPAHPIAIFIFLAFMVYKNVRGHAGFEFTTTDDRKSRNRWLQNYSIHHNDHHQYGNGNYGLYFTIWDKLMKTMRKEME